MIRGRLVFFGTEAWGAPCLEALIASGYDVVAVITRPDSPSGRGRTMQPSPIKQTALAHGIPVLTPERVRDILPQLATLDVELGVLIAYGKIIPQDVLDHFKLGILNLHPSQLPSHRGPSPVETGILEGAELGHYSVIRLSAAMDAGDVVARGQLELAPHDTQIISAPEIYAKIGHEAAPLILNAIDGVLSDSAIFEPQDHIKATLTPMVSKHQALIDWVQPATAIARKVRAHHGWPGSKTMIDGIDVAITQAHAGDSNPLMGTGETGAQPGTAFKTSHGELAVITGHGELIIDRLKPAGKNEMTGQAFLAGHPLH